MKARPTRCVFGLSVTLSSSSWPIAPSIILSMCAVSRNRNGRLKTLRSSTTGPNAPTLTRASCKAPTCACSIASFSPPSCIDTEPPAGSRFELLAHVLDRLDRRIAFRMDVRGLEYGFLLRRLRATADHGEERCREAEPQRLASIDHVGLPCSLICVAMLLLRSYDNLI